MHQQVGREMEVLVESRLDPPSSADSSYFGMGLDVHRRVMSFAQLLEQDFHQIGTMDSTGMFDKYAQMAADNRVIHHT